MRNEKTPTSLASPAFLRNILYVLASFSITASAHDSAQHQGTGSVTSAARPVPATETPRKPSPYLKGTIAGEALDEAKGGKTLRGTPVTPRTAECFPAEPRDLFWKMDWVADPESGVLEPLNFDENGDGKIDDSERDAIRGRNTWLLWGGGNEAFWGWLQEQAYGINDFLILLDSRRRGSRFEDAGLINQPGFETSAEPILGLYLDKAKEDGSALLRPPPPPEGASLPKPSYGSYDEAEPEFYDAQGRLLADPVYRPTPPPGAFHHAFRAMDDYRGESSGMGKGKELR